MRILTLALLGAFLLTDQTSHASSEKPNIVFFLCDDLGYADLACYGHPYAKTPAIDKLASEGTRFTQHYVTGVTCNPSRTGLMTGLFPARFQKYAANHGFGDRVSITELLKKVGYATGHFGKWHIGPKSSEKDGMYGLDEVKIIGKSREKTAGRDDDLTTEALEFINKHAGKSPFYVNIWGHSTHFPVNVPEQLASTFIETKVKRTDFSESMQQKFDECIQIGGNLDESMRQYLGDVYSVDRNISRIMQTVDELGIRDNTIFIFSSDHGPAPVILANTEPRQYSDNMLGYAGIHRGGKHDLLEGGTRVPFIIRWPGKVKANRVDKESVTSFIDWMPTLAALTGMQDLLPEQLDGEDISDIWFGQSRERTKPLYWKPSSVGAAPVMREGKWKLHMTRNGSVELYDVVADPAESKNLAEEHPDVAAELTKKVKAWANELPQSYEKATKKNKAGGKKKKEHQKPGGQA